MCSFLNLIILKISMFYSKLFLEPIINKYERLTEWSNERIVLIYLSEGYTAEEVVERTSMTLVDVERHIKSLSLDEVI